MTNEAIYYLLSIKYYAWKLLHFHFISFLLHFSYEKKCKPRQTDSQEGYSRNSDNLIYSKVAGWIIQLTALPKTNFPYAFFSQNFQSNPSFEPMFFREGFEGLYSIAKLIYQTRKVSKYQRFTCAPQSQCSEIIEKAQEKCPCLSPASVKLPYDFIKQRLHHGRFPKYVPAFFSGQLFHSSERRQKSNLYLFKSNNYCCGRAVKKGQLWNLLGEILRLSENW